MRDDALDFCEIVCRKHNLRGAHILLEVLARFRARYRYDEGTRTQALGQWPSDGELGERGVLPPCDGLKRRPQSEVVLDISAVKARQLRANVVGLHFLYLGYLGAQHPAPEHGVGHHRHAELLAGVDLALFFRIA